MTDSAPKYHPYIDGLRALAVVAVLLFHAELGLTGGYVGVDVFFVISGFLITRLILKDLHRERFSIVQFWERRIRRLAPALSIVVLSCLVAGWCLFFPWDFKKLGQSAFAQAMLIANMYFWHDSGYFSQGIEVKPLLHTWSLAVEEQFYLIFPFLLLALHRVGSRALVPLITILGAVSFALSIYCSFHYPTFNFYFLPTRAWELLMGAILAVLPAHENAPSRWPREALSWVGLGAILIAVFSYDRETRFPGLAALLPCGGVALIIWANRATVTSVGKVLSAPAVVFVGLISYSLYLWHWPLMVFWKYSTIEAVSVVDRLLLVLASVVLGALSWRFVERPVRERRVFQSRASIFAFMGTATATVLVAGVGIHTLRGIPSRIPAAAVRFAEGSTNRAFLTELTLKEALAGDFTELGAGNKSLPITLMVWGDSHAMAVMPLIDSLCREYSVRGVAAAHSSTAPLLGYESRERFSVPDSPAFNQAVLDYFQQNHVRNVVIAASWDGYLRRDGVKPIRDALERTLGALESTGARIWLMRQVPSQRLNIPRALALSVLFGKDPVKIAAHASECRKQWEGQQPLFEGLSKYPALSIVDPIDVLVGSNELSRVAQGERSIYCDTDHLTVDGAMLLRPLFEPLFKTRAAAQTERIEHAYVGIPRDRTGSSPASRELNPRITSQ